MINSQRLNNLGLGEAHLGPKSRMKPDNLLKVTLEHDQWPSSVCVCVKFLNQDKSIEILPRIITIATLVKIRHKT